MLNYTTKNSYWVALWKIIFHKGWDYGIEAHHNYMMNIIHSHKGRKKTELWTAFDEVMDELINS